MKSPASFFIFPVVIVTILYAIASGIASWIHYPLSFHFYEMTVLCLVLVITILNSIDIARMHTKLNKFYNKYERDNKGSMAASITESSTTISEVTVVPAHN